MSLESIFAKLILNLTFWPFSFHWLVPPRHEGLIATLTRDQPKKPAFHRPLMRYNRELQFALPWVLIGCNFTRLGVFLRSSVLKWSLGNAQLNIAMEEYNTADLLSRFVHKLFWKCWSVTFSLNRFPDDVVITPQSWVLGSPGTAACPPASSLLVLYSGRVDWTQVQRSV